jgi:hypothetical protein
MTQLARGEPLSPVILNAPTMFPFSLHNAAGTVGHLTVQCMHPPPANDEFVGMVDYVTKSFYDLLVGDSRRISDSDSSRGSHHSSRECLMAEGAHHAETTKGHITNVHEGEVTPPSNPDDEVEADGRVPPNPRLE